MKALGLRAKRSVTRKEVIIEEPKYLMDAELLEQLNGEIVHYNEEHKLLRWPNPINVFFREGDDHAIERISEELEATIEDLGNTRDKKILQELNNYPIMAVRAHTRPFQRKWMNIVTGLLLPAGVFFYIRMIRFRLRLYKDLRIIRRTSDTIIPQARQMASLPS